MAVTHPLFGGGNSGFPITDFLLQQPSVDDVNGESIQWRAMAPKWDLIDDVMGGTETMRSRGVKWLPQEPKEKAHFYQQRLERSYLYNALADTVEKLVAKPFSRDVTLEGTLPERLERMPEDMTRQGSNLTAFAREQFDIGVKYGMGHVLVDHPQMTGAETLRDVRDQDLRPFCVNLAPKDLIGFKFEINAAGERVLTQARIREHRVVNSGDFLTEVKTFVRVFEPDNWQLWMEKDKKTEQGDDFELIDSGVNTLGEVPLLTWYINRTGFMMADPPLESLAWLNVAHWQSWSDQRNILRHVRSAILFARGFPAGELENLEVGPNNFIKTGDQDAEIGYVEHSGKGIDAGHTEILSLEDRMQILGLQPLIAQRVSATATGNILDERKTESNIQSWIRALENLIVDVFSMSGRWVGIEEMPEDLEPVVFSDFGITTSGSQDADTLIKAFQAGVCSRELFITEFKRRGIYSEMVEVEDEIQRQEEEASAATEEAMKMMEARAETEPDDEDEDTEGPPDAGE